MALVSIVKLVSELLKSVPRFNAWKKNRRQMEIESRVMRYLKNCQVRSRAGAVWYTSELLIDHGVISSDEQEITNEALLHLCQQGLLDYSEERYYLKGRVPQRGLHT